MADWILTIHYSDGGATSTRLDDMSSGKAVELAADLFQAHHFDGVDEVKVSRIKHEPAK